MHLLIVEDDEDHEALTVHALKQADLGAATWQVARCLNEALDALATTEFALVLLDLTLPDSSYDQTLEQVLAAAPKIPVIVLTSLDDRQTIRGMIAKGASDCLPKSAISDFNLERSIVFCLDRIRIREAALQRERLEEQEKSFRLFFERSNIGFFILRKNGELLKANPSFTKYLNVAEEDLPGRRIKELVEASDQPALEEALNRMAEGDVGEATAEISFGCKDAVPLQTDLTFRRIDWASEPDCLLASVFDLTDRKAAEAEAKEANQAKGALFSMLSHDIRAPIGAMISLISLLKETPLTPTQEEIVNHLNRSGDELLNFVDEILKFSEVDGGKVRIQPEDCDVHALLDSVEAVFRHRLNEKNLHYNSNVRGAPPRVCVDRKRVLQVLSNIVGNAVKFTPDFGRIFIDVSVRDGFLVFKVSDTGPGIPEEVVPRLFQAFSQADEQIRSQYGGHGLGLSICQQLCEQMGGKISVRSTLGQGSCFTFSVQLAKASGGDA